MAIDELNLFLNKRIAIYSLLVNEVNERGGNRVIRQCN